MNSQRIRRTVFVCVYLLAAGLPHISQASAADSFDSLVAEIQAANRSGSGEITLSGDIILAAPLPPITSELVIDGGGHTINGNGEYRIFDVDGGVLSLIDVALTDGQSPADEDGGAIRMGNGARVSIENASFMDNLASNGGAIAMTGNGNSLTVNGSSFVSNRAEKNAGAILADGGALQISDSQFAQNCAEIAAHSVNIDLDKPRHAPSSDDGCPAVNYVWPRAEDVVPAIEGKGGAIQLRQGAQARIIDSTFSRNKGTKGGAVATDGADVRLVVSGSSIRGNKSKSSGGAVFVSGGMVNITASSLRDNITEERGGALFAESGSLGVSNATFHNNLALSSGGVLLAAGADVTLTHVTMIDNRSSFSSGEAIHKESGIIRLRNSLISTPARTDDCSGGIDEMAGNLSSDGTCAVLAYSEDLLVGGLTGSPARYPLLDFSPAVDAAAAEFCLDSDQIGTARPQGGGCDIGAIEATDALPKPPPIEPPPPCPLSLRIVAANTDAPAGGCPAGNGHDVITLTEDITLDEQLPNISSDITIDGNGYTISGGRRFRIFTVDSGTFTVNNLTLAEGKATSSLNDKGGAIRVQGSGSIAVYDATFRNNTAAWGGAIGGGSNSGRRSTIDNSRFVSNQADSLGGAVEWTKGNSLKISNSSFHKNWATYGDGGAIGTLGGVIDIDNSTFIQNWAKSGGAVYARWGTVTLTHVTMYDNSAFPGAGLMAEDPGFGSVGIVKLRNSLLAGGGRNECGGRLAENAGNLIDDGSCSPKISGDPLLQLPEAGSTPTYLGLLPASPAIDAADSRYCLRTDQLGRERPRFSLCDIGAIELIPVSISVSDCRVTTTHTLNFREQPGGTRFGTVPENATMRATARTAGWFQVEYRGTTGWISADYVAIEGECG